MKTMQILILMNMIMNMMMMMLSVLTMRKIVTKRQLVSGGLVRKIHHTLETQVLSFILSTPDFSRQL